MTSEPYIEIISEIVQEVSKRSEYYEKGFMKLVLVRTSDSYKIHSGVISFSSVGEVITEGTLDYGNLIFVSETFELRHFEKKLINLAKKGTFSISTYESLPAQGNFQQIQYYPSKNATGYLYSPWPRYYLAYSLSDSNFRVPHEPLLKPGLPLYPDGNKAITDFLDLRINNPASYIFIQVPDFKLRIEDLVISGNTVRLTINSKADSDQFIGKFYADMEKHSVYSTERLYTMQSPELSFVENQVAFTFENDFEYILGVVMDIEAGDIIDYRGYSFGYGPKEGVTLDLQELEIQEIIRRGENLQVELKQNLDNPDRILKTVVAFANTRGGRIFIGASDDTRIIGFDHDKNSQIENYITGNLDPLPSFEVSNVFVNQIPITIIEVPEGENKPYSHRELGFFVRSGSSNRSATRTDMDEIYKDKQSSIAGLRSF